MSWRARLQSMLLMAWALLLPARTLAAEPLRIWHAYRGQEEIALRELCATFEHSGHPVELLAIPFNAYASKLEGAIKLGRGPDVFLDAHERLGSFQAQGLLAPVPAALLDLLDDVEPADRAALTHQGVAYGVPIADKSLALYVNPARLPSVPTSFEELLETRAKGTRYPIVWETNSAYFHAPLLHGLGGRYLGDDQRFGFVGEAAQTSLQLVLEAQRKGQLPEEPNGALVTQLFLAGEAASVLGGPWLAAELPTSFAYRVQAPPPLRSGAPLRSFLTVEAAFLTPLGAAHPDAQAFVRWLTGREGSLVRARTGRQVVAQISAWSLPELGNDGFLRGFREAAKVGIPTPSTPAMRAVWVPSERAIQKVLRGDVEPKDALERAARQFDDAMRPPPPAASPLPLVLVCALLFGLALLYFRRSKHATPRPSVKSSLPAWGYVAPAALAAFTLVGLPLIAGALTSLFVGTREAPTYVGLANYIDILTARGGPLLASGSFWLTLLVTLLWTAANLFFHVSIGLCLGLMLSRPLGRIRGIYRTLLILPWAIPSYVTALAWKGMFHRQLGAINAILELCGAEPISFFSRFSTAFAANLATNVWLGFPFMMVVTLSALTSLPKEVLEAAEVDGATPWQRFRLVTLPLLKPTLLPSIVLGGVWTFNMFNVVFLVSGGDPDGETDILVSEAYRWAFTREAHYGYAAAYAVLIFLLLAASTRLLERLMAPSEGPSLWRRPNLLRRLFGKPGTTS